MRALIACSIGIVVVGSVAGIVRWNTWQADFLSGGTAGICLGSTTDGNCDFSGVKDRSNVYGDVAEIDCAPGEEVTLTNGLASQDTITVTGVDFGLPDGSYKDIFHFDGATPWLLHHDNVHLPATREPASWPITIGPDTGEALIRLHLTLVCSPEWMQPGSSIAIENFRVHYQAFGRDRVTTRPLLQALQITMPAHR